MTTSPVRARLLATTMITSAAIALAASAGLARAESAAATATAPDSGTAVEEVVVTGSIFRHKLSDTAAPLTVLSASDLADRGITTIQQGLQNLADNGSSALPNSFTAQGAFAAGASAVSLRGLTSDSTLVLIDGLRTAYYPLADDGTRNFVDLNSIPDVIVDRIETLKDGASSSYGADAIAGVVNVITKKTYQGLMLKAEGGLSQKGGGAENQFQILVGAGDLHRDGYNVYLGVEYEHDFALFNNQRGFPYNTSDLSSICGTSLIDGSKTCEQNNIHNGLQFDGSFLGVQATIVPIVRPYSSSDPSTAVPLGDYQLLNSAAGCGTLKPVTITPAEAATGGASGIDNGPVQLCQQDGYHQYGVISPDDKRVSASFRFTKDFGSAAEAYFTASYYRNDVYSAGFPSDIRQQSTPGPLGLPPYSTADTPGLTLPVYVCSAGVNCSAANGTLNPNNPFAALGEVAKIVYGFGDIPVHNEQVSNTFRASAGIAGHFDLAGEWHYSVDATATETDLRNVQAGELYIANLLTAVATGSYNFVNPSQNTTAERNFVSPTNVQKSNSKLDMLQGSLTRDLFKLPGGMVQVGIIGSVRYESIYNPSANPDNNGATNRYFTINPFGTIGSRYTEAAAFEIDAPVLTNFDVNVSGRYDSYSTGESDFSPKFAAKFSPIKQLTLRATYSEGFRIPSFAEAFSLPTTGFVTSTAPASFQAAHGNDGYGQNYSLGETEVGTPGLKPETSRNVTVGFVVDPIPQISVSFDYYNIVKNNVITGNTTNLDAAINAYYAGTPIPAGYSVLPGIPDPNFPNAQPTLGFIKYGFTNLNREVTSGFDFGATAHFDLPYGVKWTSAFDGSYTLNLDLETPNGIQHYAGSIGPYFNVAASGTPRLRANWANTLAYGPATGTLTAYYTDGYQLQAEDYGDTIGVCVSNGATASAINAVYLDGVTPVRCKVKSFLEFDLHLTYRVTPRLQLYADVQNLFDVSAPFDPTTYGGYQYNPAWANSGIYGRYFKFGAQVNF